MPPNALKPSIIAYSGISVPLRTVSAGAQNVSISQGSGNLSYSATISEKSQILGIQASVNLRSLSFTTGAGSIRVSVSRDGKLIASTSQYVGALVDTQTYGGLLFYDTLGFLSGAEAYQGEVWTIAVDNDLGAGSGMVLDVQLTLSLKPQETSFTSIL